ncbi:TonB-dependent receptor plug domain-containing protein [Parvicella tangerina]|uniref:Vitamin B12 transporter BtuB n=1 Tax=Parvicella tangerina TaxID=2829795 RepID=A0A916JKQ1_9FLAO|nr:TonB-dependent receptor [Parvicella tangerina]CAG5076288.1 Vitamin B12 transporter BtuB [Parvicella tangerina]
MRGYLLYAFTVFLVGFSGWGQTVDADTLKPFTKEVSSAYSTHKIEPAIIRKVNGENLGELLQFMTPNFVKRNGPGGIASISIRGGSAWQTQLFWEGVAINSPTLGQSDLSLLPSEFFSSVDINHSGASSQFGMGGLAGSVSLHAQRKYDYGGNVLFEKKVGSFGMNHTTGKFSFAKNAKLFSETTLIRKEALNDYPFINYSKPDKPIEKRKNGAIKQLGIQENIRLKSKLGKIKWITNYLDTERGIPAAIGVQENDATQLDRNFKTTLQLLKKKYHNHDGVSPQSNTYQFSVSLLHDQQNYNNKTTGVQTAFVNTTLAVQAQSTFELKKQFAVRTQLNEYLYRADSDGFDELIFQNRLSGSVIGSKQWEKSFISLTLQELLIDSRLSPIIANLGAYTNFYTGQYGHQVFGNAGTNYRYPSLNDLYWSVGGNTNLLPERSVNLELGVRSIEKYNNRLFEYQLTYFQDYITNWIQWIPNSQSIWTPENVKSVNKKGMEVMLQFRKKLSSSNYFLFTSNYRWVNATVSASTVNQSEIGNQLIYTPNHIINLDGFVQLKCLAIRYNQTLTSKFYLDRSNLSYLPYSAPANLTIKYHHDDEENYSTTRLTVGVTIHNIWDEAYQIVANQPMPGRWLSIELSINLNNKTYGKNTHE